MKITEEQKYKLIKWITIGHRNYQKWLNTPTNERQPIVGDPVSYFLNEAEMLCKSSRSQ